MSTYTPEQTREHLRLLAIAYYHALEFLDPYSTGAPMLDCKRPFGNSGVGHDVCEIIGLEPEGEDDDPFCYSSEQYKYGLKLYTDDLTPFLKEHGIAYFKSLAPKPQTP